MTDSPAGFGPTESQPSKPVRPDGEGGQPAAPAVGGGADLPAAHGGSAGPAAAPGPAAPPTPADSADSPAAGAPGPAGSAGSAGPSGQHGTDQADLAKTDLTKADLTKADLTKKGPAGEDDGEAGGEPAQSRAARPAPRTPAEEEAAFLALVARFDEDPGPDGRSWPAAEDVDTPRRSSAALRRPADGMPPDGRHLYPADTADDTDGSASGASDAGAGRSGGGIDIAGLDDAVRAAYGPDRYEDDDPPLDAADDDEDHYIPPPAPPIPKMRPVTRWALGSIALGVAFLVVPALIGLEQSRTQEVAGVLLILGGVGTLVARMGDRPPTDSDGPDDGAVV